MVSSLVCVLSSVRDVLSEKMLHSVAGLLSVVSQQLMWFGEELILAVMESN